MPNLFARTTPLTNVAGRIDYISSPNKQENLLAVYDSAKDLLNGQYWQVLAEECQDAFAQSNKTVQHVKDKKTGDLIEQVLRCREGREIHMLLSNCLLERMSPEEITQIISKAFEEKYGTPNRVALHFNPTKKSLHAHIILPERHLLEKPAIKTADRNLFFDANGKRRYRKSDILDANGQLLPGCRIVKKGEVYQQRFFSNADVSMRSREWLKNVKTDVILQLRNGALRGDIEITEYDPTTGKLAQQYVGKKVDDDKKADIEYGNELVKQFNSMVDAGRVSLEEALAIQQEYKKQAKRTAYLAEIIKRIQAREREDMIRAQEEERKKLFGYADWRSSATGRPYYVRAYDENGRKRSTIELMIILAIVTIRNESGYPADPQTYEHRAIKAKVDYKVQAMLDTVRIAREEGIQTSMEIDERLNQTGKALSKARAEAGRLASAKANMDEVAKAIADQRRLEGLCERIYAMPDDAMEKHIQMAENDANLERYKQAKAIIYRSGVADPTGRQEFLARYTAISGKLEQAEKNAAALKDQYRRLSKLRYNLQLAQNRQYCYNLDYFPTEQENVDRRADEAAELQIREDLQKKKKTTPTDPDDR